MSSVIIGASGYIGRGLFNKFERNNVIGTSSKASKDLLKFDLSSFDSKDLSFVSSGDYVFLLSAISSPDICANNTDYAKKINLTGTKELISEALKRNAKVVFFSSDTVYGNSEESFDESKIPAPIGIYANMKNEVERTYLGNKNFKSLRLSYVFSMNDKFTQFAYECYRNNMTVDVFHPFSRSIIYYDDLIEAISFLPDKWDSLNTGVINCCGPETLSRKDFVRYLTKHAFPGLKYKSFNPGVDFFNSRPRVIRMKSKFFYDLLGREPLKIDSAIKKEYEKKE